MPFSVDAARKYIDEVQWQFARAMRQWPHEYTVKSWRPDLDDAFGAFVVLIQSAGVVKLWPRDAPSPRYRFRYLAIDGWEYWTMTEDPAEATLINRASLAPDGIGLAR